MLSSGDCKKSIKTEGKTKTNGEPFTITATFPASSALHTLSGRSVDCICGYTEYLESPINCSNCP